MNLTALLTSTLLTIILCSSPNSFGTIKSNLEKNTHKIVHEAYVDGNWELFISNADGSNQKNLTNTLKINELYPQCSPDGSKICFLVDAGTGRNTIRSAWVMNRDGTGRIKISNHARQPCWAPDSKRIVWLPQEYKKWNVVDYYSKGLMFYDVSTKKSTPHPISDKIHHLYNPSFSSNGKWIAATVHAGMGFNHAILLIEANGPKIINLGISGCRPCLKPNGNQITWGSGDHTIEVADIDLDSDNPKVGKRRLMIRDKVNKIYHSEWSPEGKYITFSRGPNGKGDLSKPSTYQGACEMVGVFAKDWNIFSVANTNGNEVDFETASPGKDYYQVSKNGLSYKEADWLHQSK